MLVLGLHKSLMRPTQVSPLSWKLRTIILVFTLNHLVVSKTELCGWQNAWLIACHLCDSLHVGCLPCDNLHVGHSPCPLFGPPGCHSMLLLQPWLCAVQDRAASQHDLAVLLNHLQQFQCVFGILFLQVTLSGRFMYGFVGAELPQCRATQPCGLKVGW